MAPNTEVSKKRSFFINAPGVQYRVRVIMPQTVKVGDPKARLSHLIACAEAGEDVIIARDGVPAARIVPASGFAA